MYLPAALKQDGRYENHLRLIQLIHVDDFVDAAASLAFHVAVDFRERFAWICKIHGLIVGFVDVLQFELKINFDRPIGIGENDLILSQLDG